MAKYASTMPALAKKYLAEGYSKEATCGLLGIRKQTFYRWLDEPDKKDFSDAVEEGEALSQKWWEDRGRDACKDGEFNGTVWSMNMKNRFGWRDKQEVTGPEGGALVVQVVRHGDE